MKGVAFERFLGDYFKGKMGQYFTPRELVEFIIKMIQPDHEDRILDPACGSGGFLLYAMDHIQGQASQYYKKGTPEYHNHWHNFARDQLFGIEVNDAIARVAKMNMILHDDGHSNVIGSDALINFNQLCKQNRGFEKEKFDIILTNPPFGANIKREEKPYLDDYELGEWRNSQKTEILFLERCFEFLKWGTGRLAIVLPDGILNNSSLQYVRDYIEQHFQILAVVSLPQIAFKYYEAGVKPSILLLQKFSEEEYSLYQASIRQITEENEAIYIPRVTELEKERKKVIAEQGCPAQVAVTELYELRFRATLDNIEDLNRKLDKKPTQTFLRWRDRFVRDTGLEDSQGFELFDKRTANEQLKTYKKDLTALVKEYKEKYKAASDSEWESQIKEEYKEKIDAVKEALADKNAEDIRQWVRENANHSIFMAIAEHIGYDATGREDSINDLNAICDEYHRFRDTEDPDFFRVSPDRENQIFLTYRGETAKKRIDPFYHQEHYKAFENQLNGLNNVKSLAELLQLIGSGMRPKGGVANIESGVLSFGGEHVNNQCEIEVNTPRYIPLEFHSLHNKTETLLNDLLLVKDGATTGKIGIVSNPAHIGQNINEHLFLLRAKDDVNSIYLLHYLNSSFGKLQIQKEITGATVTGITRNVVKQLKIILPAFHIQNHIAEIMQSAYTAKKQKDQEADAILDSINDYMLAELGIEMPVIDENKCFVVRTGEIEGRIDPLYVKNIPHFRSLKTSYSLTPLREFLTVKPQYGASERAVNGDPNTDCRYIRITDLDDYGNLLDDDWQTAEEIDLKYLLQENDVLFARSGSVGRAFVYKSIFGQSIFAGYLIRFKFNPDKVNPSFVFHYTLTKIYKLWVYSVQRTTVQANINSKEFQSLEIPLPPLDVQNRIVEEVNKRLAHIEELRQEGDTIVEAAKEEIVSILLAG